MQTTPHAPATRPGPERTAAAVETSARKRHRKIVLLGPLVFVGLIAEIGFSAALLPSLVAFAASLVVLSGLLSLFMVRFFRAAWRCPRCDESLRIQRMGSRIFLDYQRAKCTRCDASVDQMLASR